MSVSGFDRKANGNLAPGDKNRHSKVQVLFCTVYSEILMSVSQLRIKKQL